MFVTFVTFYIKICWNAYFCVLATGSGLFMAMVTRGTRYADALQLVAFLTFTTISFWIVSFSTPFPKPFSIRVRRNTISGDVCLPLVARVGRIGGNDSRTHIVFQQNTVRLMVSRSLLECAIHCFTLWNGNCLCISHKSVDWFANCDARRIMWWQYSAAVRIRMQFSFGSCKIHPSAAHIVRLYVINLISERYGANGFR